MTDIVERLRLDAEPSEGDMETAAQEIEKLRAALNAKGCSRDQTTTQYCAEVVERDAEIEKLRAERDALLNKLNERDAPSYRAWTAMVEAALGEKE